MLLFASMRWLLMWLVREMRAIVIEARCWAKHGYGEISVSWGLQVMVVHEDFI